MQVAKKPEMDERFARLRLFRGKLPADFKFDRDEANAMPARAASAFRSCLQHENMPIGCNNAAGSF